MCWNLFFNKADSKRNKEVPTQVFSCEYCEFFKNTFLTEHLRWLLLLFKKIGTFTLELQWQRLNTFVFLINTTEYNKMLMCYSKFCISILLE